MGVRFSITIRQHKGLRELIEAPEQDWTPFPTGWTAPPMWPMTPIPPSRAEPDAAPVRLIVRRVKPTPGSQLALFATYHHGFITDRDGETLELEADHRRHAEIEPIRDLKPASDSTISPRGLRRQRRLAGGAGDGTNLARWTARIGLANGP